MTFQPITVSMLTRNVGKHGATQSAEPRQGKALLLFPGFSTNLLMRTAWDPREDNGQIKILLSEDLISATEDASGMEPRATNHVVCFSFRHAPRGVCFIPTDGGCDDSIVTIVLIDIDILEQAGIAWPLRNPLYLPFANAIDPTLAPVTVPQGKTQLAMGRTQVGSSLKLPGRSTEARRKADQSSRLQPHDKVCACWAIPLSR